MKRFLKRKLLFMPLTAWLAIVVLLVVGGLVGAYVFAQVTSESEVVEPLDVTYIEHFDEQMWPCYSSFLTFDVENEAPVPYGLRLTVEEAIFPENVHFGELLISGGPYTWGDVVEMPANGSVHCSIEVVAECDAAEGPVSVTINVERLAPGAPPPSPTPPTEYDLTVTSAGCCPIEVAGLGTVAAGDTQTYYDIAAGTTVALTADDSDPDCTFVEWTGDVDLAGNVNPNSVTMDADKSVTAVCEGVGYDLTVTSDGCCPIDVGAPVNQTVAAGETDTFYGIAGGTTVALTADDSDPCCDFVEWSGDIAGAPGDNPNSVTMDADKSVTATCEGLTSDLTVTSAGCCPITVAGLGTVAAGDTETFYGIDCCTTVTLTADDSDPCCDFVEWTGDVDLAGDVNPNEVHMDGTNKSVTATCTWQEYDLTVTSDGCCAIDVGAPISDTVAAGETQTYQDIPCCTDVTLTALIPGVGDCVFDGWELDGVPDMDNPITVHMDSDHTAVATCHEEAAGPPTWAVDDYWVFDSKYYLEPPTLTEDDTEVITVQSLDPAGSVVGDAGFTLPEDCYGIDAVFTNDAGGPVERHTVIGWVVIDPANPPLTWNSQLTLDEVYREAWVGMLFVVFNWEYLEEAAPGYVPTTNHGWPYDVGKEWASHAVSVVYIGAPGGPVMTTVHAYSIVEVTETVDVTVPAGTFGCSHVVNWEVLVDTVGDPVLDPDGHWQKTGVVGSETWFTDDCKFRVRYIDRATYTGEQEDLLESYSLAP